MAGRTNSESRSTANDGRSDKAVIVDAIRAIARDLRSSGRQIEQTSDVTGAQLDVLRALQSGPAYSINDLAARTFTHQSSVSMIVGRLAGEGLVTRTPSKTDARRLAISLTARGKATLKRSPDSSEQLLLTALKGMNRQELADLAGCLEKLSAVLGKRTA